jgi:hypothetical protein
VSHISALKRVDLDSQLDVSDDSDANLLALNEAVPAVEGRWTGGRAGRKAPLLRGDHDRGNRGGARLIYANGKPTLGLRLGLVVRPAKLKSTRRTV